MILKDTELFLDEAYRKSLQKQLINRFLDIYKEVLQDFMHFLEKNKIELDAENILLKETLNTVFEKNPLEDSIKIFTVEEMSNFLGILI